MPAELEPLSPVKVRVEDGSSMGRSYSQLSQLKATKEGLGAERRALRTRSFDPFGAGGQSPITEAYNLAKIDLKRCSRHDILSYFKNTWALSDWLFSALRDDSVYYVLPDKLRRPLIFYFAHPAAVYANKLVLAGLISDVDYHMQKMFETGVDEMSWDDMDAMQSEDFCWPSVAEALEFRNKVYKVVCDLIEALADPCAAPENAITMDSPLWSIVMGFEHEKIHLETSSVLIRQLPIDAITPPPGWRLSPSNAPTPDAAPQNKLVATEEATVVLGKPRDFPSFDWDNAYGRREVTVPAFKASAFLVTNAEFLPFVLDGGYSRREFWVSSSGDDEGWRWCAYRNATHPSFWVATSHPDQRKYHGGRPELAYQKDDGHPAAGDGPQFKYRAIFSIVDMPWDWPVDVNYHEAQAFLRWKSSKDGATYRVPTEAEWHVCRGSGKSDGGTVRYLLDETVPAPGSAAAGKVLPSVCQGVAAAGGADAVETADEAAVRRACLPVSADTASADVAMQPTCPGNLNMRWHSSSPVDMFPPTRTGFYDTQGNVWQWGEDHFAPFPGFEIHPLYDDFSTPCFDGFHTVILGGSWISSGQLASSFARYHFRRHFFQHLGFRYVRVETPEAFPGAATVTNLWEGMSTVSADLTDAYGADRDRLFFPRDLFLPDETLSYSINLARYAAKMYSSSSGKHASNATVLHIGCGVGGGTFDLVRAGFGQVVGVDVREPAIRQARILQHHGQVEYERVREGVLTETTLVRVPAETDRTKVVFHLADATKLSAAEIVALAGAEAGFDVVVIDNVLCRLNQPLDLTTRLREYVRPGGVCIVASNNDWKPTVTPRNSWIGGYLMNGEALTTVAVLGYNLKRAFEGPVHQADISRVRRVHARRHVVDVLEVSAWTRRQQ